MMKSSILFCFALVIQTAQSALGFGMPITRRRSAMKQTPGASSVAVGSTKTPSSDSVELQPSPGMVSRDQTTSLLDDALLGNTTAATVIMNEFSRLRSESMDQAETFADSWLEYVDGTGKSKKLPLWARLRPLARFSRRARVASLRRVLDLSTPTSEEKESVGDDRDAERRRRRRSLLILVRSLADMVEAGDEGGLTIARNKRVPAVVRLERAARREAKSMVTNEDMTGRLPPGLETPKYSVLVSRPASKGGYEVRRYEPFTVCSVQMSKPRPADSSKTDAKISNPQLAGASAFGALAGYLFGKNQEQTAMKMTTPVLSEGEGDERSMSFVLPSEFWKDGGLDSAPKPLQGSGVSLQAKAGEDRAVVMFGGFAAKKDVAKRTKQLLDGLAKDKNWMAVPRSSVALAQYNDPFTPPWKRRNEVSIKVQPRVAP